MICIQHRMNSIDELRATDKAYGVEIDIRNHGEDLFVVHDPFSTEAIRLENWLDEYDHRFLIANVKEEGLEPKLLDLLAQANVRDFFILDETIPYIRKYALEGVPSFAVRVSEYESVTTALNLANALKEQGKSIDWIWMDSFTGALTPSTETQKLRAAGFKLCQVSPELHHVGDPSSWNGRILALQKQLNDKGPNYLWPDMVCTKRPEMWGNKMTSKD